MLTPEERESRELANTQSLRESMRIAAIAFEKFAHACDKVANVIEKGFALVEKKLDEQDRRRNHS